MKRISALNILRVWIILVLSTLILGSCEYQNNSDRIQKQQQEVLLREGTAQIGMPAIKNFRERKLLKDILEMRDQTGLITYTYLENMIPSVSHGHTALGGKLTYLGESIGYGIPYSTQFTNPQKQVSDYHDSAVIAQADPNGLFSPSAAEGTWVLLKNPNGGEVKPVYIEPRVVVSQFKFPMD